MVSSFPFYKVLAEGPGVACEIFFFLEKQNLKEKKFKKFFFFSLKQPPEPCVRQIFQPIRSSRYVGYW